MVGAHAGAREAGGGSADPSRRQLMVTEAQMSFRRLLVVTSYSTGISLATASRGMPWPRRTMAATPQITAASA